VDVADAEAADSALGAAAAGTSDLQLHPDAVVEAHHFANVAPSKQAQATAAQLEAERLAAVPSDSYDRLVRLAQAIARVPIAALNFLGRTRQFTAAAIGLPVGVRPLSYSFYSALASPSDAATAVYEVRDLAQDPRFSANPLVSGAPFARFYAGIPLRSGSGKVVGVLSLVDVVPRSLTENERTMLLDLSALLERELAGQEEVLRAGEVQARLLPTTTPDLPGIEIAGRVVQAREAGGDFFDWQEVVVEDGMNQLQLVIADVMGKGLSAALLASEVRAVLRGHSRYTDVASTIGRTTKTTRHDLETNGLFVTLWMGRIDPSDGRLEYVDAGHGLVAICSPRGVRRLKQDYLPLGIPIEQYWRKAIDRLDVDEYLVAVSDGIYDTLGALHTPFDLEAAFETLQDMLRRRPGMNCAQVCDEIVEFAKSRQGPHTAVDDCTALVVRRTLL